MESGHRQVIQARLKIAGAWWHPKNLPGILALRILKANDWWDEYWESVSEELAERTRKLRAA